MYNKDAKRLVIDADVAQASGHETATHQRAINCRDFLIQLRSQNHILVLTNAISEEWKEHQSRFTRKWRLSMYARKRIIYVNPAEDHQLRHLIATTINKTGDIEVMQKDIHLLEAALETDQTMISLDETVRTLFAKASQNIGEIRHIIWVNPNKAEEQPITWLKNGAPSEQHRVLLVYLEH